MTLICSTDDDDYHPDWSADTSDYEIVFNPQNVCWNYCYKKHIFREKTGFTDTIRLHIVEYAAVFSKPEIGNLFA